MGLSSSTTKQTSNQTSTSTPTTPSYATPAISNYYNQVSSLGNQIAADPTMFVTPANDTQLAAFQGAQDLGKWKGGLDQSNQLASQAAATKLAPIGTTNVAAVNLGTAPTANLTTAQTAQLGPANQTTAASILDTPISNYLNPATDALVNTTLAGYDQQSGIDRAAQQAAAAKAGAFGGSRYGIAQSQLLNNQELGRANTEANLRSTAFDKATNLAAIDAAARQSANLFNTGAQNDFALNQGNLNQQTNLFNAGAQNDNSQYNTGVQANYALTGANLNQQANLANASAANTNAQFNAQQKQQQIANQLQASGLLANNASTAGTLSNQDVNTQLAAGQQQYAIDQAANLAPLTSLSAYQGLLDPSLLAAISGQNVTSTGTSSTTQPGGIFGSLLGIAGQIGSAALLGGSK